MSTELVQDRPWTAVDIRAQVNLIQQVMESVMKEDTHYGVIPGCQKPSLWKPGAEKLLVTFRIAPMAPKIEDLSTPDCIRYRITRSGQSIITGAFVGAGVGECSSDEEKYKWRFAVCQAEWDATPEDRRRLKYKRDGSTIQQIRTNPADVANTVLKIADKRAYVALGLVATAASDIFTQDIEDLPEEIRDSIEEESVPKREKIKEPEAKVDPSDVITEAQGKRLYAIWKGAGRKDEDVQAYLKATYGIESTRQIKKSNYEAICKWAEGKV